MNTDNRQSNFDQDQDATGPVTARLHPRVYAVLIALAAWFALAVWSFAGGGVTDYLLVIVSGFIFVVVALQLILSRVSRADDTAKGDANRRDESEPSLRSWAKCNFDTWTGRQEGAAAATEILLPIAAAAVGMTAIGIVFLAERGG